MQRPEPDGAVSRRSVLLRCVELGKVISRLKCA
jgi:hypothetical protein